MPDFARGDAQEGITGEAEGCAVSGAFDTETQGWVNAGTFDSDVDRFVRIAAIVRSQLLEGEQVVFGGLEIVSGGLHDSFDGFGFGCGRGVGRCCCCPVVGNGGRVEEGFETKAEEIEDGEAKNENVDRE